MPASNAKTIESGLKIQDLVLSEERILSANIPLEELCMANIGGQTVGPLWLKDLKEFLEYYPEMYDGGKIRSLGEEEWQECYEHTYLQRRRPQSVAQAQNIAYEEKVFTILKQGKEFGPMQFTDLIEKIEKGVFAQADLFSIDHGKSWDRIHNIESLNRRIQKNIGKLPQKPNKSPLANMPKEQGPSDQGKIEDAILGLAFIGQKERGSSALTLANHTVPNRRSNSVSEEVSKTNSLLASEAFASLSLKSKGLWAVVASVAFLGMLTLLSIYFFTSSSNNSSNSQQEAEVSTHAPSKIDARPARIAPVNRREPATRSPQEIKSGAFQRAKNAPTLNPSKTSFTRSRAFGRHTQEKQAAMDDYPQGENVADDGAYYDDGSTPVEQLETRAKLSKETIDPGSMDNAPPPSDDQGREIIEPARPMDTYSDGTGEVYQ